MAIPQYDEWPIPQSLLLLGIVDALRARSKALKKRVSEFEIAVSFEMENDTTVERLDLHMQNGNSKSERLSLALWDDGEFWLDARQASKAGWVYEFSFYGNFADVASDDVREMIEQSLWVIDRTEMETIWSRCNLSPYP